MTTIHTAQRSLFDAAPDERLPAGLRFEPAVIDAGEERELLALAAALPLRPARYKQYTAQRRVHAWGARFDFDDGTLRQADVGELPPALARLRQRLAAWAGVGADDFIHVMLSEYQRGTPLGWHRDAPGYELIVGVSLGSPARLRLRPFPPRQPSKADIVALDLAPRSAYLMAGVARWGWQHSVPPVPGLRYSVTLRTARRGYPVTPAARREADDDEGGRDEDDIASPVPA